MSHALGNIEKLRYTLTLTLSPPIEGEGKKKHPSTSSGRTGGDSPLTFVNIVGAEEVRENHKTHYVWRMASAGKRSSCERRAFPLISEELEVIVYEHTMCAQSFMFLALSKRSRTKARRNIAYRKGGSSSIMV